VERQILAEAAVAQAEMMGTEQAVMVALVLLLSVT
jgi:hypothetical protein